MLAGSSRRSVALYAVQWHAGAFAQSAQCSLTRVRVRPGGDDNVRVRVPLWHAGQRRLLSSPKRPAEQDGAGGGEKAQPSDKYQTIKMMAGIALGASVLGAFFNIRAYERRRRREEEHGGGAEGQVKLLKGAATGKPLLGGEYTLVNQDGKVMRNTDFHGTWAFLYFGFTYCPDICPNELTRLQEILSILDKENKGKEVTPVFITIDPQRDGPAQIDDACKKFRVYANKAVLGDDPNDYLIDHSVMFYLVDPSGEFVDYYGGNLTPTQIASRISESIDSFQP